MAQEQESVTQEAQEPEHASRDEHNHEGSLLGPLLCWAVVFADIGTSVYYVPGLLYGTADIGKLAGFFVFLTMSAFVLLTLKYAEVTHRFPQGGGVVTVAAQAINHWVGALGGMFILVDYFLTAAISCLSGMQYFSVVLPAMDFGVVSFAVYGKVHSGLLVITIVVLVLLGILNWVGISESAKVSLVGAVIAFISDIAILITVFSHISFSEFLGLFPQMFAGKTLTPYLLLTGFAGSFLAFSGLESISQLSPVMRTPRKKVARQALLLVVLTIGLTSPLLTMLSTTLLSDKILQDPNTNAQVVSLLAGHWGGIWGTVLQTEVAISASALLVFASNTAIIGAYHVFLALSRMEFFPAFVLKRNKLRGTPHYSIALATGIPILVLVLVGGRIDILGDMYAFGLLGAFSLTCLGLDIVRHRERKAARAKAYSAIDEYMDNGNTSGLFDKALEGSVGPSHELAVTNGQPVTKKYHPSAGIASTPSQVLGFWNGVIFWLGILTTILVITAWTTNLVTKLLATAFGGSVTVIGMAVAYFNYRSHWRKGRIPVITTGVEGRLPGSILAVLTAVNGHNDAVMRNAINSANGQSVVFLFLAKPTPPGRAPRMFEVVDPYLEDEQAKEAFGKAEHLAKKSKIARRFLYRQQEKDAVAQVWQIVHPRDTVVAADTATQIADVNPDRIRYELTPAGKVAHLLKRW